MDQAVPRGKQAAGAGGRLSPRDLFMVETMLRTNAAWIVTCHNAHIVQIQPVAKALHADSIPMWWIVYARANDLEINL